MLCIIVPNQWTVSPEFFAWVRTRRLLCHHSCPVCSLSLPNQKRRNYRWVEKRLRCYQQEQFILHWENSVSDGSQCIINNRKFKMRRRWESKKAIAWQGKTTTLHHTFCTFLCHHCTTTMWKCLISGFVKDVNKQWQIFFLFMDLDMVDRKSAPEEFACNIIDKVSELG